MPTHEIKMAEIKAQTALLDMQIKIATDSIMRLDVMIEACVELRKQIEGRQKEAANGSR